MALQFWKKNKKPEAKDAEAEVKPVKGAKVEKKEVLAAKKSTEKTEKIDKVAKTEKKEAKKADKKVAGDTRNAPHVLIRPMVTEKTTRTGTYAFVINTTTTRSEVRKAIKAVYGVTPTKVNIINMQGKKMNFGRVAGARSDWKKAIVMLKKGETISVE